MNNVTGAAAILGRCAAEQGSRQAFLGQLTLRLPPELHRKVYTVSKHEGKSLNQWIAERLERAT